ncbi:MAG: YiiG family protein [Butyrivibrio sp.]|nr:YiiG family protein [Acetatifactor muris]MCM1561402.1 YiiG family protein [Butyrivibrio sp.]
MKKKFLAASLSTAMVLSLAACQGVSTGRSDSRDDDGSDSLSLPPKTFGSEDGAPAAVELDEETEQELYNAYIDVNNAMVGRIFDSLDRYFTYVDFESDDFRLLDENDPYYTCYTVTSDIRSDIETAYEIAASKTEKDALDQAFLDMYPYITTLVQTLNEISDYTDLEAYREDNYAKSQEHHTALLNVLEAYYTTGDTFRYELSIVAEERQQAELEEMKAEGYVVFYSLNMVINLARDIDNELYMQGVWDENILDMDLTVIQPMYEEFSKYVDDVLAYSEDEEALSAEGLRGSAYLSLFVSHMKSTRESLEKVLAKVEKGEPLSEGDMMFTLAGQCSISSFEAGLSDMIDMYNTIISY